MDFMEFEQLGSITDALSEFVVSPNILWGILFGALLLFSIVSAILVYHWVRYGRKNIHIAFAEIVYFPVTLIFIGLAVVSIIMYTNVS